METFISISKEEMEKNKFIHDGEEYSRITVKTPTFLDISFGVAVEYAEQWFAVEDYKTVPLCRKGFKKDFKGGLLYDGMNVVLESGEEVEISRSEILQRAEQFLLMELETIKNMRENEDE